MTLDNLRILSGYYACFMLSFLTLAYYAVQFSDRLPKDWIGWWLILSHLLGVSGHYLDSQGFWLPVAVTATYTASLLTVCALVEFDMRVGRRR